MMLLKPAVESDCLQHKSYQPPVRYLELCAGPSSYLSTFNTTTLQEHKETQQTCPAFFFKPLAWLRQMVVPFSPLFSLTILLTLQDLALMLLLQWSLCEPPHLTWSHHFLLWTAIAFPRTFTLTTVTRSALPGLDCTYASSWQITHSQEASLV